LAGTPKRICYLINVANKPDPVIAAARDHDGHQLRRRELYERNAVSFARNAPR
jgi:hypothetical protein